MGNPQFCQLTLHRGVLVVPVCRVRMGRPLVLQLWSVVRVGSGFSGSVASVMETTSCRNNLPQFFPHIGKQVTRSSGRSSMSSGCGGCYFAEIIGVSKSGAVVCGSWLALTFLFFNCGVRRWRRRDRHWGRFPSDVPQSLSLIGNSPIHGLKGSD